MTKYSALHARPSAVRLLIPILCLLCLPVRAAERPSIRVPAPVPEPMEEPPPAGEEAPVGDDVRAFRLAREGRALLKEKQIAAGVARLRQALALGLSAGVPAEDEAGLREALAMGLLKLKRPAETGEAIAEYRAAAALQQKDAQLRIGLAGALLRADDYDGAIAAARQALALGARGEDADDARDLLRDALDQRLHDRLQIDAAVAYGFDSNVLQGFQRETIAGRSTVAPRGQVRFLRTLAPIVSQWGLPLNLSLELGGRIAGTRRLALWGGYRFFQTVMTYAQQGQDPSGNDLPDRDTYHLQEHTFGLRLQGTPLAWWTVKLRAEGFVNFTGLQQFSPYLGGVTGTLDNTFIESARLRTRVLYSHQFRTPLTKNVECIVTDLRQADCLTFNSFGVNAYGDQNAYLAGNRDQARVHEELRTRFVRAQLGYQFTSDLTADLEAVVPIDRMDPAHQGAVIAGNCSYADLLGMEKGKAKQALADLVADCAVYHAPLAYQGHQVYLTLRALLPHGVDVFATARYEHLAYAGTYRLSGLRDRVDRITPTQRVDHRISLDAAVSKELPRGFLVELGYGLIDNLSNIDNIVDNRSYFKHTVLLSAFYSF